MRVARLVVAAGNRLDLRRDSRQALLGGLYVPSDLRALRDAELSVGDRLPMRFDLCLERAQLLGELAQRRRHVVELLLAVAVVLAVHLDAREPAVEVVQHFAEMFAERARAGGTRAVGAEVRELLALRPDLLVVLLERFAFREHFLAIANPLGPGSVLLFGECFDSRAHRGQRRAGVAQLLGRACECSGAFAETLDLLLDGPAAALQLL